jgi:hypothetical protein
MAEIQDIGEDVSEIEAVEQKQAEVEPKPELAEKYRGKAIEDVVRMHQEAEKLIDRQAKEVGEVRRLADELLRSQLVKPVVEEKQPEVDFFENPQEAIRRAVDSNPKVLAAEQYSKQAQQEMARQKLVQLHPDFGNVVQDGEFQNWVKSSKVRTRLFNEAEAYDVDSADELLSTFKQLKTVKQTQVKDVDNTIRDKTLKSVAVDTGGSGETSKKVYRRADLIQLKLRDPQGFAARQDEIDRAYQEGRVR